MEKFRNLSNNIFFKIFLAFVGVSFITFGISDLLVESNNSWVAKIGDKKISEIKFERKLEEQKGLIYSQNPRQELLEYLNSDNFRKVMLQRMVSEELLKTMISDFDLKLDDKLSLKQLLEQDEFKGEDGKFDKRKFISYLRINNLPEDKYIDELKFKIASNIIFSNLDIKNVQINPDLLVKKYQFEHQKREVDFVIVNDDNIKKIKPVTSEEISDFYEKNKKKFRNEEMRKISLISLSKDDLIGKINISDADINAEYKNSGEKYIIPEKRGLYHIFFSEKKEADDFLTKIDKNKDIKKQFIDVAKKFFDKEREEIIINVSKNELPESVAKQVFQDKVGNLTNILNSDYGYHILYIDNITPSSKKSLSKVRSEIIAKLQKQKSDKIVKDKISDLEGEIMLIDSVSELSKKFPFVKVKKLSFFDMDMMDASGNEIKNKYVKKLVDDIFFLDEKQFSEIYSDEKDNKYYFAFLDKIKEESQKSLKNSKSEILKSLTTDKRRKELTRLANEISMKVSDNLTNVKKIIRNYKLKPLKSVSLKRDNKFYPKHLVAASFSLKKNEVSKAIKISDEKYYISILRDIILPEEKDIAKKDLQKLQSKYQDSISADLWLELERYLQDKYQVRIKG